MNGWLDELMYGWMGDLMHTAERRQQFAFAEKILLEVGTSCQVENGPNLVELHDPAETALVHFSRQKHFFFSSTAFI